MKQKNWIFILMILVCLAVFVGYRQYDALRTDTDAPVITVDESQLLQVSVKDPKSALLKGVTAKDKKDGDVTASLVVESMRLVDETGLVDVGYAAFDEAGNVAKAERQIRYTDYTSPKFYLNRPLIYAENTTFDVLSALEVSDVFDGDIQHRIRATMMSDSSISVLGEHYISFRVTTTLGDSAKISLPVEVYSAENYNASMTLNQYLVYLPQSAVFNPEAYLDTFTLMGEEISLENGLPDANYSLKTSVQDLRQMSGPCPVDFWLTYTDRHETNPDLDREYTAYTRLIVVVEG